MVRTVMGIVGVLGGALVATSSFRDWTVIEAIDGSFRFDVDAPSRRLTLLAGVALCTFVVLAALAMFERQESLWTAGPVSVSVLVLALFDRNDRATQYAEALWASPVDVTRGPGSQQLLAGALLAAMAVPVLSLTLPATEWSGPASWSAERREAERLYRKDLERSGPVVRRAERRAAERLYRQDLERRM